METGIIKRYSNAKGYGFVIPDSGADDVFLHISALTARDSDPRIRDYLHQLEGMRVEFTTQARNRHGRTGLAVATIRIAA